MTRQDHYLGAGWMLVHIIFEGDSTNNFAQTETMQFIHNNASIRLGNDQCQTLREALKNEPKG